MSQHVTQIIKLLRWSLVTLVFIGIMAGLLLWLTGYFAPKVAPGTHTATTNTPAIPANWTRVPVEQLTLPRIEPVVGTIKAVHEVNIAARIMARVMEINLKAGQAVQADQVLVRLDDRDLQSRINQANATLAAVMAQRDDAEIQLTRIRNLIAQKVATQFELDKATVAHTSALAEVARAQQMVSETKIMLDHSIIKAPLTGTVVDKKVEVGDMVTPGQILLTLYDPTRMQMVASVREGLIGQLQVGQQLGVKIDAFGDKLCSGTISEIVPLADPASRSFQVKVTGPCPAGLFAGTFGRLQIPLETERLLVIPARAIQRVGQLEMVYVAVKNPGERSLPEYEPTTRSILTGRSLPGDKIEILSGLTLGEVIFTPPAQ